MKIILSTAFLTLSVASASAFGISINFAADGSDAVVCDVKGVTLLAESMDDCKTVGGTATHQVSTTAVPVAN